MNVDISETIKNRELGS